MPLFSHYGDLPDISYRLSYPSLFFSIFTPLVVITRLVSRKVFAGKVGVDDWTILTSAVSTSLSSRFCIADMTDKTDVCGNCINSNDLSYVLSIRAKEDRLIPLISVCEWSFGKHVEQVQDESLLTKTLKVGNIADLIQF
jgi:hypothetical protein